MVDRTETDVVAEQRQRAQLKEILSRARRLRDKVSHLQRAHGDRVHFRPGATGIDMVSLVPERPFVTRAAIRNLDAVVANFEAEFQRWCLDVPAPRITGEKRVQAWLLRSAFATLGRLAPVEAELGSDTRVTFVTDDLDLPYQGRRFACDLLALIEAPAEPPRAAVLEFARAPGEGAARVVAWASLLDDHRAQFAELFSVLLARPVSLEADTRSLLFWPGARSDVEAHLADPRARGITTFHVEPDGDQYRIARV